jgi:hypothetical protein
MSKPITTTPFPLAVRMEQIAPEDFEGDLAAERRFPFFRITNWYAKDEEWMLIRALRQLGSDIETMVVESTNYHKAIYRRTREVAI